MSLKKIHQVIPWKNKTDPPINDKNLNQYDHELDALDDRIIELDTVKLPAQAAGNFITNFDVNPINGVITVTYYSGRTITFDTNLEKLPFNYRFDETSQILYIIAEDGTEQICNLSSLISQYEFQDSTMIAFSVNSDSKVTAMIKKGSITEELLQPNFLADVRVESARATVSADIAAEMASDAQLYAEQSKNIYDNLPDEIGNFVMQHKDDLKGPPGGKGATGIRGSRWSSGTAITGTSTTATVYSGTGITDALVNDMYLNISTGNVYRCTTAGAASVAKWVYTGNIKGAAGVQGIKGDTGAAGAKGATGATGVRGSRWSSGTAITGTSTTATVYSGTGITDALINDMYLNISTGNVYRCTAAGAASVAKWVYTGNIKGAVGAQGIKGDTGAAGVTPQKGIDYWTDSEKQEIISAAAVKVDISGKLDKTGDSTNAKVTFTSGDNVNPTGFANIDLVSSGEKHGSLMRKFSLTVKNVRYLWKMIGTTDISAIGGGTLTGAINALNTDLESHYISIESIATDSVNVTAYLVRRSGNVIAGYVRFETLKNVTTNNNIVKITPLDATYYMPIFNITDNTTLHGSIATNGYVRNHRPLVEGKVYIFNITYITRD